MLRFYPFFVFCLLWSLPVKALTCVEDNRLNCKALGFTETKCDYGGIACPFDASLWHCAEWTCEDGRFYSQKLDGVDCFEEPYKGLTCYNCDCPKTNKYCSIGSVFYADGTCSSQYDTCVGKIPVGVVYMLTDANGNLVSDSSSFYGRVISLKDLTSASGSTAISWGASGVNISGLNTYSYASMVSALKSAQGKEGSEEVYDGAGNTSKIVGVTSTNRPIAADATVEFYPDASLKSDSLVGSGKWYMPSFGELEQLYGFNPSQMTEGTGSSGSTGKNIAAVNATLEAMATAGAAAEPLDTNGGYYLSSTSVSTVYAWVLRMSDGTRSHGLKNNTYRLRASLKFNNSN